MFGLSFSCKTACILRAWVVSAKGAKAEGVIEVVLLYLIWWAAVRLLGVLLEGGYVRFFKG